MTVTTRRPSRTRSVSIEKSDSVRGDVVLVQHVEERLVPDEVRALRQCRAGDERQRRLEVAERTV